jgi:hypothetical protein
LEFFRLALPIDDMLFDQYTPTAAYWHHATPMSHPSGGHTAKARKRKRQDFQANHVFTQRPAAAVLQGPPG